MRVTAKRVQNAWIEGKCGDYVYWAKVYDEPSHYGIKNGRISKLEIRDFSKPSWYTINCKGDEINHFSQNW